MPVYRVPSPAKINFTLEVVGQRPDGFHDLRMLMQTVSLYDTLTITIEPGDEVSLSSSRPDLPTGQRNLVVRAALYFLDAVRVKANLSIALDKQIPVGAGLGGGSSNAACVLKTLNAHFSFPLNEETLVSLALSLGSDVPFFLRGGLQYAEGRGERLTSLPPLPRCFIVLCKPDYGISTAEAFHAYARGGFCPVPALTAQALQSVRLHDLPMLGQSLFNQLEPVLSPAHQAEQAAIRAVFRAHGAVGDSLSGSGPTRLGLFLEEDDARKAATRLSEQWNFVFITQPV